MLISKVEDIITHCRRHQLEVIIKWCRYCSIKERMLTLKVSMVTHCR